MHGVVEYGGLALLRVDRVTKNLLVGLPQFGGWYLMYRLLFRTHIQDVRGAILGFVGPNMDVRVAPDPALGTLGPLVDEVIVL